MLRTASSRRAHVDIGLGLPQIQMADDALNPVIFDQAGFAACRARKSAMMMAHPNMSLFVGYVDINTGNIPRILKAQESDEELFVSHSGEILLTEESVSVSRICQVVFFRLT
jgi:hypothetical protein